MNERTWGFDKGVRGTFDDPTYLVKGELLGK